MTRISDLLQKRISIIAIIIFLFGLVVISRLWFMQIIMGKEFLTKAEENRVRIIEQEAPRGIIYDREGRIMVKNRPSLILSVLPAIERKKEQKDALFKKLSTLLNMPVEEIEKKFQKKVSSYTPVPVKEDVDEKLVTYIKEHQMDFQDVMIEIKPVRSYVGTIVSPHLLGYLGEISKDELKEEKFQNYRQGDIIGKTGVEYNYEIINDHGKYIPILPGINGKKYIEVDAYEHPLRTLRVEQPVPGKNLYLTINIGIQNKAQELLEKAISEARKAGYRAPGGSAVVINPRNGEILALVSSPVYDPNIFIKGLSPEEWKQINEPSMNYPLNNRAITNSYPPASVFKVITATAALSEGFASPYTPLTCTGIWTGAGSQWPQKCWKTHGRISFNEALIYSCDSFFYQEGYNFYSVIDEKGNKLQEYAYKFGLGSRTQIDLPAEDNGRIPTPEWKKAFNKGNSEYQIWYPGDSTNMSVGQGDILTTPLQMANVFCAIANNGIIYKPRVVKEITDNKGKIIKEYKSEILTKIDFNPTALSYLHVNLPQVTTTGTAKDAFRDFDFNKVSVAGKTGSAEVAGKQTHSWFACYAPAEKPEYVVVAMIEEAGHGSTAAAPVVRGILDYIYELKSPETVRTTSKED